VITIRIWMDLLALFRFLSEGKRKDAWAVSRAHQNFIINLFKPQNRNISHPKAAKHPLKGVYKGSLVWAFFVKNKKHFTDLDQEAFH
ncbi:MAG: glycosyltransferase family 2 protein, partial [Mucilaginibacter sp.]